MTKTDNGFDAPELRRLRYFYGRLLSARDLQREQEYFREKLKLRMRCLLGYGVVCGLLIEPEDDQHGTAAADAAAEDAPEAPAPESAEDGVEAANEPRTRRAKVRLTPGLGVDACGNEIVVRHGCEIDLFEALPAGERSAERTTGR